MEEHGESRLDLTDTSRADLIAYKTSRETLVQKQSWHTEASCLSGFFRYADAMGWIESNPVPHWGKRNTFSGRGVTNRSIKFLTDGQLRLFVSAGLRGDAPANPAGKPAYSERDYAFGLVLATTGLRRKDGAFLLDAEVPTTEHYCFEVRQDTWHSHDQKPARDAAARVGHHHPAPGLAPLFPARGAALPDPAPPTCAW